MSSSPPRPWHYQTIKSKLTIHLQANRKYFKHQHSLAIFSDTEGHRQQLVDRFQNIPTGDNVDEAGRVKGPGILLGSTRLIGVGYTLTRASALVLFDPDYTLNAEEQAHGRISRQGQRNLETKGYRLLIKDLQYELRIQTRQAQRRDLQDQAYAVQESLPDPRPKHLPSFDRRNYA